MGIWSVMKSISALAIGALTLVLGACSQVVLYKVVGPQRYSEGEYDNAAKNGEIRTVIVGNPFGVAQGDLDRAVTRAMTGAPYGPVARFTTSPSGSAPYRVVMAFNAPPALNAKTLCAPNPTAAGPAGNSGVRLFAVFCLDDVVLSESYGRVSGLSGPDARGFQALVSQVTTALFPAYDFHDIGGDQTM